jgi:hypothetical protein
MSGQVDMSNLVPLKRSDLARVAPNYEAMRNAIAVCVKVDEIAKLSNQAMAAQAYFRQAQDVENEMQCSRWRVQAERKLGVILKRMADNGERDPGGRGRIESRGATQLKDLGIPKDRASRAMQLADVPQDEFDAALAEPRIAQPRRILEERKPVAAITKTLNLWGRVRDLGAAIASGDVPPVEEWRADLQPFQLDELRRSIPLILEYLNHINGELQ